MTTRNFTIYMRKFRGYMFCEDEIGEDVSDAMAYLTAIEATECLLLLSILLEIKSPHRRIA